MATRWSLGEQILRLLNGGNPSGAAWAKTEEIYIAVGQVLNKLLKVDHVSLNLPSGETIPAGSMIVTYDSLPIITYKGVSKCTLPAIPIALPRDMGLTYVGPSSVTSGNTLTSQFIPIPPGQAMLLANQPMISTLLGQIAYERKGLNIIFTEDITASPNNITSAQVEMIVADMSQYGDYDLLPIPADMEGDAVTAVYKLFAGERSPDKVDDPITNVTMNK